ENSFPPPPPSSSSRPACIPAPQFHPAPPKRVSEATVGMRRGTLPSILPPPPAPGVRPPLAANGKEWFAGDCNRKTAEALLLRVNKDGAFLIRHSSAQSSRQPYTLAVLFEEKVYNIPIRYMQELRGFALGKEGKTNEEIFSTLDEMISYHQQNQLLLIDSRSQAKRSAYLTHPARP
uniref:SH2 domain-containing protein n=1 Tax=Tetraodon nigroviridis TaxID=99883 RepID=H3C518_TETNG